MAFIKQSDIKKTYFIRVFIANDMIANRNILFIIMMMFMKCTGKRDGINK